MTTASAAVRYQYMPPLSPETRYTGWALGLMVDLSPAFPHFWHVSLIRGGELTQTATPIAASRVDSHLTLCGAARVLPSLRWRERDQAPTARPPYSEDDDDADQYRKFVYFIQAGTDGLIKIGITRNVRGRLENLQTASPALLTLLAVVPNAFRSDEMALHARFAEHRSHGEWFYPVDEITDHIHRLNGRVA